MTQRIVFPNAPIIEALLDIRTELPSNADLNMLASFQGGLMERYPTRREQTTFEFGFQADSDSFPQIIQPTGGPVGYVFESSDGKKLVQATKSGFTFNKLKPYESWEIFVSEAKDLWDRYLKLTAPTKVTRIALRYINRLELPRPFDHFREFILTAPEVAPGVPQGLSSFLMRLVIPHPQHTVTAIVTESLEPLTEPPKDSVPILFDIDVFQVQDYAPNDGRMWETFEILREFKDDIFFNSMTDTAKRLFE